MAKVKSVYEKTLNLSGDKTVTLTAEERMTSITDTLADLEKIILEYKQKAIDLVEGRKSQNPALKPLGANCFTIKFSDLSQDSVLSPQYYDFVWQYDAIIEKLRKQTISTFKNTLIEVIQTGKLDGRRFHPDVIAVLKELL